MPTGDTATAVRTAIYRFFDANDELLYVGITNDPLTRFRDHKRNAADTWWPLVDSWLVKWLDSRPAAAQAEVMAIECEAPRFNERRTPDGPRVSESGTPEVPWAEVAEVDWVSPAEISRRVSRLRIGNPVGPARVRQLVYTPEWPVPRAQWRRMGNTWLFPWPPVEEFMRSRVLTPGRRTDLGK